MPKRTEYKILKTCEITSLDDNGKVIDLHQIQGLIQKHLDLGWELQGDLKTDSWGPETFSPAEGNRNVSILFEPYKGRGYAFTEGTPYFFKFFYQVLTREVPISKDAAKGKNKADLLELAD